MEATFVSDNDKHARQDERAAAVIAREKERMERRKNALPPFLMIRSGLLNGWFVTLGALGVVAAMNGFSMNHSENVLPDIAAGILGFAGVCYGIISTKRKNNIFKQDIEIIKDEFDRYITDKNYSIYLAGKIYSPKLARILIRDIAEHNPYVFDKMITTPDTITDPETQSHVIFGYLRRHPGDAQKVIDTFEPGQIDPKVYNKALKYANRLKNSERQR